MYLCVYFFIYVCMFLFFVFVFRHGYLLHNVVYNTVVCINTIIYFSMGGGWRGRDGKKKRQKNHKLWQQNQVRLTGSLEEVFREFSLDGGETGTLRTNKQKKNGILNFPRIHSHVIFHFLLPALIWSYWFFLIFF